ncbi:hypothetical protein [Rhodococcus triatomae]|nr:hypothetical protein G419_12721 [Rhodococcus triatomae BKS 15-14]
MTIARTLTRAAGATGLALASTVLLCGGATATAETRCASYPPFVPPAEIVADPLWFLNPGFEGGPVLWNDSSSEIAAGSSLMCSFYPDPPNIWLNDPIAPR